MGILRPNAPVSVFGFACPWHCVPKRCSRRVCSSRSQGLGLACPSAAAVVCAAADCIVGIACPNAAAVVRAAADWRVGIVCPNAPVSVWHRVPVASRAQVCCRRRACSTRLKSGHHVPKRSCERLASRALSIACPSVLPPSCVQQPIKSRHRVPKRSCEHLASRALGIACLNAAAVACAAAGHKSGHHVPKRTQT